MISVINRLMLNTGRVEEISLHPSEHAARNELSRMVSPGKHTWQWPERWRIETEITETNAWFSIFPTFRARVPASLSGLAWTPEGAAELWPMLERSYLSFSEKLLERGSGFPEELLAAPEPPEIPWLTVTMLPGIAMLSEDEMDALTQLERALAFAIVRWAPAREE